MVTDAAATTWRRTVASILTIVCAGLPIGGWMLWSKFHFGDFAVSEIFINRAVFASEHNWFHL